MDLACNIKYHFYVMSAQI